MNRLIMYIVGIIFFMLPLVSVCNAQKQTVQEVDGKTLFEKKCGSCHGIKKLRSEKIRPEWTDTVMRMKNKNGAPVNDNEARSIIEHLAKNYGK